MVTTRLVDKRKEIGPRLLYELDPDYPEIAHMNRLEGAVILSCLVTKHGDVAEVEVEASSGHYVLDRAARVYTKRLKFDPARQGDEPVDIWIRLILNYTITEDTPSSDELKESSLQGFQDRPEGSGSVLPKTGLANQGMTP
jgi:TonB family protein